MELRNIGIAAVIAAFVVAGCQTRSGSDSGPYGETSSREASPVAAGGSQYERYGQITDIDLIETREGQKFGIASVVGAVAGGVLGNQVGGGSGRTAATIAGTIAGGMAGQAIGDGGRSTETTQRVTVQMNTGGTVTVMQPRNASLSEGMSVAIVGSGESARVVPR